MPQTPNVWNEAIKPRIIADSREYLRRQTGWLNVTTHDFSDASGKLGDTVTIPIPMDTTVGDLSAGQLPPTATGKTFPVTTLVLDKARASEAFTVEQIHLQNYQIAGPGSVLQQQINSQIDAVVGDLASDFANRSYPKIPTFIGAGGTKFFANNVNNLASAHRALFDQRVPKDRPKFGILSSKDWEDMGSLALTQQAYSIGTPSVIQNYEWPSIMGFGMHMDYFAPTHTAGTIGANGVKVTANNAAGVTSIGVTNGAANTALKAGDIVSITTGSVVTQYSVQADLTLGNAATGTLALDRGLDSAVLANDAITITTNFASGRTLILGDMAGAALVTRIPSNPTDLSEMPVKIMGEHIPITDPVSGITVLLSFYGQYFQRTMITSLIWGHQVVHPARLLRGLSAV